MLISVFRLSHQTPLRYFPFLDACRVKPPDVQPRPRVVAWSPPPGSGTLNRLTLQNSYLNCSSPLTRLSSQRGGGGRGVGQSFISSQITDITADSPDLSMKTPSVLQSPDTNTGPQFSTCSVT